MPADPEVGVPDLIRRLTDDSKRLVRDEVRLAKLEVGENIHAGARGAVWLGIAFGAGVVALVALTFMLAALLGRLLNGNYWAGALITGALELGVALLLVKRGLGALREPSYTFAESRAALRDTAQWARDTARTEARALTRADAH
jgi:hypothetical protein